MPPDDPGPFSVLEFVQSFFGALAGLSILLPVATDFTSILPVGDYLGTDPLGQGPKSFLAYATLVAVFVLAVAVATRDWWIYKRPGVAVMVSLLAFAGGHFASKWAMVAANVLKTDTKDSLVLLPQLLSDARLWYGAAFGCWTYAFATLAIAEFVRKKRP